MSNLRNGYVNCHYFFNFNVDFKKVSCCMSNLKPIFHCDTKKVALGPGVGLAPQRHYFALGIPTCWYLKMLNFAFPPTQNIKFAFPPTQNPNASQWNIGCVGSLALGLCVGHVRFIFFVLISLRWVANANAVFSGILA